MRLVKGKSLQDTEVLKKGQELDLIEVEREEDWLALEKNILTGGLYDEAYFAGHGGLGQPIFLEKFFLACLVSSLRPHRLLDLGCGAGDVPLLVKLAGEVKTRVLDVSPAVADHIWPPLAPDLAVGPLVETMGRLAGRGERFDTITAFDLWEHLPVQKLAPAIAAMKDLAADDALFLFNIPGFGPDRVHGEVFPLNFEENRAAFEGNQPFRFLPAWKNEPPIPWDGHLIWAPAAWWEEQFAQAGLVRLADLEEKLHRAFDRHLFFAQRCLHLYRLDTEEGLAKEREILKAGFATGYKHRLAHKIYAPAEDWQRANGRALLEPEGPLAALFHLGGGAEGRLPARDKSQGLAYLRDWFAARKSFQPRRFPFALTGFLSAQEWAVDNLVWTGAKAGVRLAHATVPGDRRLCFDFMGWRPGGYDPDAIGIKVWAGSARLALEEAGEKRLCFRLPGPGVELEEIEIRCKPFVPAKVSGGDDKRKLGLDIDRIYIETEADDCL